MTKLFVSNIAFAAVESDLREFFSEAGYPPSSLKLILDRQTGQSKGYAFVEVQNGPGAIASLHARQFMGLRLRVQEAISGESGPRRYQRTHAAR
jgi:RNA recognition motif-containing protein